MPFTSLTFLLFFLPLVVALAWTAGTGRWRTGLLLVASALFYAWGEGPFLFLLVGSVLGNWGLGLAVASATGEKSRRRWLWFGLTANVALLVAFKYVAFLTSGLNWLLDLLGMPILPLPSFHQPVGISFFTFQGMAYLLCVARDETTAARSPARAGLLLGLFPGLLAGPIVRARELAPQLGGWRMKLHDVADGARRFIIGLAKKVLLADVLGRAVDGIMAGVPNGLSPTLAWLALVAYTLQIYLDFSGYSDMAIGVARMLGLRYPENFDLPYTATSVADFWTRWHITLSSWFRDYVFLPVSYATSRRLDRFGLPLRTETLLAYGSGAAAAMLLIGLWHGAGWHFVAWGGYFAVLLILERIRLGRRLLKAAPVTLRRGWVLAATMIGWVLFRAESFGAAAAFYKVLCGFGHGRPSSAWRFATAEVLLALVVGTVVSLGLGQKTLRYLAKSSGWKESATSPILEAAATWSQVGALVLLLALSLVWLAGATYTPFIYFQF